MKLTKKQEAEVMKVYNAYWDGYIKGDVKGMAALLDKNYTQVGIAELKIFGRDFFSGQVFSLRCSYIGNG